MRCPPGWSESLAALLPDHPAAVTPGPGGGHDFYGGCPVGGFSLAAGRAVQPLGSAVERGYVSGGRSKFQLPPALHLADGRPPAWQSSSHSSVLAVTAPGC